MERDFPIHIKDFSSFPKIFSPLKERIACLVTKKKEEVCECGCYFIPLQN